MLSLNNNKRGNLMIANICSKKFLKILSLPVILYLTLFDITFLNREIKSNKKLQAATDQDLYLYKGMGASYLCIATKAGIEFPKAIGVATATYVQVIEGKHGGILKELGDKKLERDKLFAGAEFQIVTTAIQYCPESVPKEITKKVKKILKDEKR